MRLKVKKELSNILSNILRSIMEAKFLFHPGYFSPWTFLRLWSWTNAASLRRMPAFLLRSSREKVLWCGISPAGST